MGKDEVEGKKSRKRKNGCRGRRRKMLGSGGGRIPDVENRKRWSREYHPADEYILVLLQRGNPTVAKRATGGAGWVARVGGRWQTDRKGGEDGEGAGGGEPTAL